MTSGQHHGVVSRRTPRWEIFLFLLLALVALVAYGLPWAVRYAANDWLQAQGADEVQIGDVRINLFRGQAALADVRVRDGEHPPLVVKKLGVAFAWRALLDRRAEIVDITLEGAEIPLQLDAEGRLRVGILLPAPTKEEVPATDEPSPPWGFALRSVIIDDSRIRLDTPQYRGGWHIRHVHLGDLVSWDPAQVAKLQLDSTLNEAQVALDADLQPFGEALRIGFHARLDGVRLADFADLAGDALGQLGGRVDADLRVELTLQDGEMSVKPKGRLALRDVVVTDPAGRRISGRVEWRGEAAVTLSEEAQQATVKGRLVLRGPQITDSAQALQVALGEAAWEGSVRYATRDGGVDVTLDGRLTGAGADVRSGELEVALQDLTWQGRTELALAAGTRVGIRGPVTLTGLELGLPAHRVALGSARWEGQSTLDIGEGPLAVEAGGALEAAQLQVHQRQPGLLLAEIARLQAADLKVQGLEAQQLAELSASGVRLLHATEGERPPLLRLAAVRASGVSREGSGSTVEQLQFDGLVADLERRADGAIATLDLLAAEPVAAAGEPAADDPVSATGESETAAPVRVRIGATRVSGDSRLRFRDLAVKPRFRTDLAIEKVEVGTLDTGDAALSTPVEARLRTPGQGDLVLKGEGRFFADPPDLDLRLTGRALEMVNLSPYTIQTIGYEFDAGQLNLDTTVKVERGKIRGENKLHLRQFALTRVNANAAEKLAKSLTMPLNSALALLRDKDGDIKLKIPVRGDIEKPEVDVQNAINQALGKAVRKAALGYLKHTLQPYGSIITLVQVLGEAGEMVTALKLESVEFASGDAQVSEAAGDYLSKIGELLKQRPELTIRLCGVATPADVSARAAGSAAASDGRDDAPEPADGGGQAVSADATLRELAEARARNVKTRLVEQHGVPSGRLFLCAPEVREDDEEPPSVRLRV